jgi:hypothetical protein
MRTSTSRGEKCQTTVAEQSMRLLGELAAHGIYGRTAGEVAGRLIEEALKRMTHPPRVGPYRTGTTPKGRVRIVQPKFKAAVFSRSKVGRPRRRKRGRS